MPLGPIIASWVPPVPATASTGETFLKGLGAAGGAVVLGGVASACSSGGSAAGDTTKPSTPATTSSSTTTTTRPPAVTYDALGLPIAAWVVEENARPGTKAWLVSGSPPHGLEGFADRVSAQHGDEVTLFVNTVAGSVEVDAYRLGWYGGYGARFVAHLGRARGIVQPVPSPTPTVNMIECDWRPTLRFAVGDTWPPGYYLLKLTGSNGYMQWVPLMVRDDASRAAILVQSSVTTWQAYNLWGGFSLYGTGAGGYGYPDRSRVVSFDRPYPANWEDGSADFFGNEYPLVALLERHGVDVSYWTDLDLHEQPQLLANHRCLVSLGHDEYWSADMRYGVQAAVDAGLNFAVLGANCCYRHIRLEPSPLGTLPPAGLLQGRGGGSALRRQQRRSDLELGGRTGRSPGVTADRRGVPVLRRQRRPRGCGGLLVRLRRHGAGQRQPHS